MAQINNTPNGNEQHKADDTVWWRWFYVSNWSPIKRASLENVHSETLNAMSFYQAEFWQKASIEIFNGDQYLLVPLSEWLKQAEEKGVDVQEIRAKL